MLAKKGMRPGRCRLSTPLLLLTSMRPFASAAAVVAECDRCLWFGRSGCLLSVWMLIEQQGDGLSDFVCSCPWQCV